jgi:hypothetical protein
MPSAADCKRRLPEMFPATAEVLEQVCVLDGSILKGINDEIGIRSFSELFDQVL